jgi:AcrR family transcriptional regulator
VFSSAYDPVSLTSHLNRKQGIAPPNEKAGDRNKMALSDIIGILCYYARMDTTHLKDREPKARPFAEAVPSAPATLKARKRQVVRGALSAAAEKLFLERGFEAVTVEEIAQAAGVSRRTFFRYYESKEDVMVVREDRLGDRLLAELMARPLAEPPLLAIRNALVPAIEYGLTEPDLARSTIRLLRETSALRRAVMERRSRLEERIAALMAQRMGATDSDNTPMLLAFLTRALHDTAFNAWYDHETGDIAGLVDGLISRLVIIAAEMPAEFTRTGK